LYDTGTATGLPSVIVSENFHTPSRSVPTPFGICLACIPKNLYQYLAKLRYLAPLPHRINIWMTYGFILAVIAGISYQYFPQMRASRAGRSPMRYIGALLRSFSVSDLYCAVYMGVLLTMQFAEVRYLIPILPFFFAYALQGGRAAGER